MKNPYRIKNREPTIAEQLAAFPRPLSIAEQVAAMPRPLSIAEQLRAREDWRGISGASEGVDLQRNRPARLPRALRSDREEPWDVPQRRGLNSGNYNIAAASETNSNKYSGKSPDQSIKNNNDEKTDISKLGFKALERKHEKFKD